MLVGATLVCAATCDGEVRQARDTGTWPVRPDSTRSLAADVVDQLVADTVDVSIGRSPVLMALVVADELPYSGDCREVKASLELLGGEPRRASVVVLVDMCSDDSIRSRWYKVALSMRENGSWRIDTVRNAWACWPGRGHERYSALPCY